MIGRRSARGFVLGAGIAIGAVPGASAQSDLDRSVGQALFERLWVPAPSSTRANDGLGPLFNARSCAQCHADGRGGRVVTDADGRLQARGAVVRLAGPDGAPDPVYGAQVQTAALPGRTPEAQVFLEWNKRVQTLDDGRKIELRAPRLDLRALGFGPLAPGTTAALSLAPDLAISARVAEVDPTALSPLSATSGTTAARPVFGRKMTKASLRDAAALAFSRDLGLSTSTHLDPAGDCSLVQRQCQAGPHGAGAGEPELADAILEPLQVYLASLNQTAIASRDDAEGHEIFQSTGCASCHTPTLPGRSGAPVTLYSDLALHDLGTGLAGAAEGAGRPAEVWRTAPLIGIARRLGRGETLLNDGRARTVAEAVLWHDGEARAAVLRYKSLTGAARAHLEAFVSSR